MRGGGDCGYSCEMGYRQIFNDSVTTTEGEWGYYTSLPVTPTDPTIRVTLDGTEYDCSKVSDGDSYYHYGAPYDSDTQAYDWSVYPFVIYDDGSFYTEAAGTYSLKIEIPAEVVETSECFEKAVSTLLWQNIADAPNGGIVEGNIQEDVPQECRNVASGLNAHAEGGHYESSGGEGSICHPTEASGSYSHAEGSFTRAKHKSQHVFGEYNVEDPSTASTEQRGTYVEIVGKGTNFNARSNARTLDWNGNEWLAGSLTLGNTTLTEAQLQALLALLQQ